LQTKTLIKAEKGQTKNVNLGWHRDRKVNPISAPSIHVGALVGAGSLWHFEEAGILLSEMLMLFFLMFACDTWWVPMLYLWVSW
jgi:hypothetical protein